MRVFLSLALLVAVGCASGAVEKRMTYGLLPEQNGHAAELVERIKQEVPERWNSKGSPHRIKAYDKGRMLDITTTPENHQKIAELLADPKAAR